MKTFHHKLLASKLFFGISYIQTILVLCFFFIKQAEGFREDAKNININLDDQNVLTADAELALTDIQSAGIDSINYTQFFNTVSSDFSRNYREVRDRLQVSLLILIEFK